MSKTAPLERQAAEREAFDHALEPYFPELLQAAQREVRHRLTLGEFAPDDPMPEQLSDMPESHSSFSSVVVLRHREAFGTVVK